MASIFIFKMRRFFIKVKKNKKNKITSLNIFLKIIIIFNEYLLLLFINIYIYIYIYIYKIK